MHRAGNNTPTPGSLPPAPGPPPAPLGAAPRAGETPPAPRLRASTRSRHGPGAPLTASPRPGGCSPQPSPGPLSPAPLASAQSRSPQPRSSPFKPRLPQRPAPGVVPLTSSSPLSAAQSLSETLRARQQAALCPPVRSSVFTTPPYVWQERSSKDKIVPFSLS